MLLPCFTEANSHAIPIVVVAEADFPDWLSRQSTLAQNWLTQQKFTAKPHKFCTVPNQQGAIVQVVVGEGEGGDYIGALATALPPNIYRLAQWNQSQALAWGMGAYQFNRYKKCRQLPNQLCLDVLDNDLQQQLFAIYLIRDLINTPTEDMGPAELAAIAQKIAHGFGANFAQIVGDDLLTHNYPAIHAVGRASHQAPRLLDLRWGDANHPKVILVGKGVCFDSGGLDIKPAANMALMKKDMAGAAHVLGLAQLIMATKLPICLRVLIPAVENAIAGNAYRPGDVITTRKGLSVEIGNTDAEGRVILADALAEAVTEQPDLLVDIATLTGAARIALGSDISGFFTANDELAHTLQQIGDACGDPLWRLPLHKPYRKLLDSPIADINNATKLPYGGAISAALFLQEFVDQPMNWLHFDIMAWNLNTTPAHPEGGEAMAVRALFAYLQGRFGSLKS